MSAYDMYMPNWSYHPQTVTSQPVNGLKKVKSYDEVMTIPQAPNSISEPYMLESDNIFFIKTTDEFSNPTVKAYRFEEIDIPSPEDKFVTKEYLDSKISEIMEALNGQCIVPESAEEE